MLGPVMMAALQPSGAENGIVRDKKRIFEHLLDHGVTALRDADLAGEVNLGAAVVVMDRRVRKAAKNV